MTVFACLIAAFFICLFMERRFDEYSLWEMSRIILTVITVVYLCAIPVSRQGMQSSIKEFESIRETIELQRKTHLVDGESYALTIKIIDANKWLRSSQYKNATLYDIFIPDEIDQIKPIE